MKLSKIKIDRFLLFVLVLFCILDFNSVYSRFTMLNLHVSELCIILCFLIPCFSICINQRLNKKALLIVVAYMFYCLIFIYFSPKISITGYIVKFMFCLPLLICYFSQSNDYGRLFFKYFSLILLIVASLSIFFYFFTTIVHILKPMNTMPVSWRGNAGFKNYFYLYFSADYSYTSQGFLRNTGIFVEAPQYGMNLVFALMYELFINKSTNYKKAIIICTTILTTISFGSILVMLMMLYLKLLFSNKKHTLLNLINGIILVFLAVGAIVAAYLLVKVKVNTGNSFKIRVDDFLSGFESWKLHPIFGNGYNNSSVIKQFVGSFRSWSLRNGQIGFSNSIAMILSNGGVYLFLTYVMSSFVFLTSHFREVKYRTAILLVFISMLFLNTFAYVMFTVCSIAIAIASYCLKNN